MKKIAFVTITWNSQAYIEECLSSVYYAMAPFDAHVWVIDKGSKDQTVEIIQNIKKDKFKNRLHFIRNNKNLGTTVSRNLALREIQKAKDVDYVCIIDSDTKINTEAVQLLMQTLDAHDDALTASPRMHNDQNVMQITAKRFPTLKIKFLKAVPNRRLNEIGQHNECYDFDCDHCKNKGKLTEISAKDDGKRVYEVDFTISACWLVKQEALDIVGLLDERIFYSPEDVDYCARVHEAGYKNLLVYDALIKHHTQRLSKKKFFSMMNLHHLKGLIYFCFKHYGKLKQRD